VSKTYVIEGGQPLSGAYRVQGNKNAALPLLAATLLAPATYRFTNVPRIVDVENLLGIMQALGVEVSWDGDALVVDTASVERPELPDELVQKLRGSVLLLGALAPRADSLTCRLPGGCPIGRRSFDMHWRVFEAAGFRVDEVDGRIEMAREREVEAPLVYLEESSVTATENALILFSALGKGTVYNPAREPHVFSLVELLTRLGAEIDLHPLYLEVRRGVTGTIPKVEFSMPADFLDAGTMAIAAAVTGGRVVLEQIDKPDLEPIRRVFERFGLRFDDAGENAVEVSARVLTSPEKLTAGLWPAFPTDLVSLATVLASQAEGLCLVHDWMYEGRMFFVDKLVRMGARITMCDPHRILVQGPSPLRATALESPDIRAGMALVVAGLCARGTTTIEHAEVIERGYEDVVSRLRSVGAVISEM
jgi:UDP-N-acetylglucosamine 1-carboxyvinyltransferase